MEKSLLILLLFSFLTLSNSATRYKVDSLFGDLYEDQVFSGYLKTKIDGDELFYIYMPAQINANIAPIMLWLNGGPGCSSLFGLLAEVGPVTEDNFGNEFKVNPYSWNKDVNLLAIEQPAGVGFSITKEPYKEWNDEKMGENLLYAVKDFLAEFNLQGREFYISGESYAGVYIPTLATYMLQDKTSDKVNLKGVLIGNGLTDFDTDVERSMVEFGFWHGMVSFETFNLFKKHCSHKPDELHPEETNKESNDDFYPRNVTHRCNEIRNEIRENLGGSDIYGIYRLCPQEEEINENDPLWYNKQHSYRKTIFKNLKNLNKKKLKSLEPEIDVWPDGCAGDYFLDEFLNSDEVKAKLRVDSSLYWSQCAGLDYERGDSLSFYTDIMPKYPDVKYWVFSGTEDGVLSTLGTMRWINKLNLNIEKGWSQYKVNGQVAGYAQKYKEGLVIVTVKGAGHMVPQDQRASAYKMYTSFIKGVLPSEE